MDEAELLERLLVRYSPSGRERAAVEEFVRIARELGLRARIDAAGNGIAETGRGRPELLFLGHIDTVEGDRPVRRVRGRLSGRGAVDAKGPLASALVAGANFRGPGTFRIVAAVREETDSRGARHLLSGRVPDAVIAGEPSGWDGVTVGYKGVLRLEAVLRRPRRHGSSPEPTASDEAVAWLARLRARLPPPVEGSPFRSFTVKLLGMSNGPSAEPDVARLVLEARLPPGVSVAAALELVRVEAPGPRLRLLAGIDPVDVGRHDPVARALVRGVRAVGGEPTVLRKSGTSDLNVVLPVWNVPGAAYGPGDARLDHTSRESIRVGDVRRAAAVLERALGELARSPELTLRRSAGAP